MDSITYSNTFMHNIEKYVNNGYLLIQAIIKIYIFCHSYNIYKHLSTMFNMICDMYLQQPKMIGLAFLILVRSCVRACVHACVHAC